MKIFTSNSKNSGQFHNAMRKKITAVVLILLTIFSACQKDNDIAVSDVILNRTTLTLSVSDSEILNATVYPTNATNQTVSWSSSAPNIVSVDASGKVTAVADGTATIIATTVDGNKTASCIVTVKWIAQHTLWGLGENLTDGLSNNVNYKWYIDQINTGQHAYINCGPACATMAIKWSNQSFTRTAEDARNTYRSDGGWWYTDDIINYLDDNNTAHYVTTLTETNHLIDQLGKGNIVILCLDMYYVRYHLGNPEWHIDKFYSTKSPEWGHFIVIKGYKIVDNKIWFEVYDPWSLNVTYNDGSLKGLDRFYRAEDIMLATKVWWKYMIVVNNPTVTKVHTETIDPSTIVHQRGR